MGLRLTQALMGLRLKAALQSTLEFLMAYGGLIDSYGAYLRPFCRRHSIKKSFIAFKLLSIKLSAISF